MDSGSWFMAQGSWLMAHAQGGPWGAKGAFPTEWVDFQPNRVAFQTNSFRLLYRMGRLPTRWIVFQPDGSFSNWMSHTPSEWVVFQPHASLSNWISVCPREYFFWQNVFPIKMFVVFTSDSMWIMTRSFLYDLLRFPGELLSSYLHSGVLHMIYEVSRVDVWACNVSDQAFYMNY